MRRQMRAAGAIAMLVAAFSSPLPAAAGEPTCSGLFGGYPHGYHIVADYVTGIGSELLGGPGIEWPPTGLNAAGGAALPGGPGPAFHGEKGVAPGASFCIEQARSGDR